MLSSRETAHQSRDLSMMIGGGAALIFTVLFGLFWLAGYTVPKITRMLGIVIAFVLYRIVRLVKKARPRKPIVRLPERYPTGYDPRYLPPLDDDAAASTHRLRAHLR